MIPSTIQHANEDVEKMLLGNKADMEDKRQISTEKATLVSTPYVHCHPQTKASLYKFCSFI